MTPSPKRDDETQDSYVIRLIQEEERERCAKIAERHAEHLRLPVPFSNTVTFRVAQEIAARIRNPDSHDNR